MLKEVVASELAIVFDDVMGISLDPDVERYEILILYQELDRR